MYYGLTLEAAVTMALIIAITAIALLLVAIFGDD